MGRGGTLLPVAALAAAAALLSPAVVLPFSPSSASSSGPLPPPRRSSSAFVARGGRGHGRSAPSSATTKPPPSRTRLQMAPKEAKTKKAKKSKRRKAKKSTKTTTTAASASPRPRPPPSKVTDADGPTPERPPYVPEDVSAEDVLAGAAYDPSRHPIPHQPWRRGVTRGCEDPIDAQWRLEAEHIIEEAAGGVGAYVECVTWYLTFVVVALGNDLSSVRADPLDGSTRGGPRIAVDNTRDETNVWRDGPVDPDDPAGFPMGTFHGEEHARVGADWAAEDEDEDDAREPQYDEVTGELLPRPEKDTRGEAVFAYNKEKAERLRERETRMKMLRLPGTVTARHIKDSVKGEYDGFQKHVADYEAVLLERYGDVRNMTETELDGALKIYNAYVWNMTPARLDEFKTYLLEKFEPVERMEGVDTDIYDPDVRADGITDDYAARLSVVGDAILTALGKEDVDRRLDILDRHEVVLTSANFNSRIVETQREFDAQRGKDVFVQTRDPWDSNRVLKGKLVDRNALDIILNVEGRMVTIPNNMVGYVYLPEKNVRGQMEYERIMAEVIKEEYDYDEEEEGEWDEEEWEEEE